MVLTHCKTRKSFFFFILDVKVTQVHRGNYIGCITWPLHLHKETLVHLFYCCLLLLFFFFLLFPNVSLWWLYPFSPPNEFPCFANLILIMWQNVCISKELASSCARDFITPPHSTLSLPAVQLEQIQQTSRDTRLFSKYLHCGFYGQTRRLGPSRLSEGWWTPEHSASIPSKRQTSAPLFLPSKSTSCVLSVQLTPHYGEIT